MSGIPDRPQATFQEQWAITVPILHLLFLVSHSTLPRKLLPHAACLPNSQLASPNHSLYRPQLTKTAEWMPQIWDTTHSIWNLEKGSSNSSNCSGRTAFSHPYTSCLTEVQPVGDKWTKSMPPTASRSRHAWKASGGACSISSVHWKSWLII